MKHTKHSSPAIIAAEKAKICYDVLSYTHDQATTCFGDEAAQQLGIDASKVFKTLIVALDGSSSPHICVAIPVNTMLDLKALASLVHAKKAQLADPKQAERLTGYIVGGISPLGQKKKLPLIIDSSARAHDQIVFSAGRRGMSLMMSPEDLAKLTGAQFEAIARSQNR